LTPSGGTGGHPTIGLFDALPLWYWRLVVTGNEEQDAVSRPHDTLSVAVLDNVDVGVGVSAGSPFQFP